MTTKRHILHLSREQYQLLAALFNLISALVSAVHAGYVGMLSDIHMLFTCGNLLIALMKVIQTSASVQHVKRRVPLPRSTNSRRPRRAAKPRARH